MRLALLSVSLFLCLNFASAQTFGSITGEVRDPSGAVTTKTQVTATNIVTPSFPHCRYSGAPHFPVSR